MLSSVLGVVSAVIASALFSVGLLLQAVEARTVSADHELRLSLVGLLARRRRWVLGGAAMLLGYGFHVLALVLAPLTAVQPALAAGLLVLLAAGARAGSGPVALREIGGMAAVVAGVVALAFTSPERVEDDTGTTSLVLTLGGLGAAALLPGVLAALGRAGPDVRSQLATVGAGAGFALTGVTTKLVSDHVADGSPLAALGWLVLTATVAAIALLDETSALQRRSPLEVGPVVFVVPVVVPVVLAPVLLGEGWNAAPYGALPLLAALVAVCVGAAALAGSASVAAAGAAGDERVAAPR